MSAQEKWISIIVAWLRYWKRWSIYKGTPLMKVRIGNQVKFVRAILQVAFVMGDQKSNDNICCRKGWHTRPAEYIEVACAPHSMPMIPPKPVRIEQNSSMSFPRCLNHKLNNKAVNIVASFLLTIWKKQIIWSVMGHRQEYLRARSFHVPS
jgi:hypothetical protein